MASVLIGWCQTSEPAARENDSYTVDELGRSFRVQFDPGSDLQFGLVSGLQGDQEDWRSTLEFILGLSYRSFLRHSAEPYMILPTDPPRRFYFPFDIGVDTVVGRIRTSKDSMTEVRLRLVSASLLLDPLRAGLPGNSLEFGLGVRYELDIQGHTASKDP